MQLRPTRFSHVARQTQSVGSAALRFHLPELWWQYQARFLQRTLVEIHRGRSLDRLETALADAELGDEALSLDEWFEGAALPAVEVNFQSQALAELAELAEDLMRPDGAWRDQLAALDDVAQTASEEVHARLGRLLTEAERTHGAVAAASVLTHVIRHLRAAERRLNAATSPWNPDIAEELQRASRRVRSLAIPRGIHWRLLRSIWPHLSARQWLTAAEVTQIERRLVPAIQRAASLRSAAYIQRAKLAVLERLLGRPGAPGAVERHRLQLMDGQSFFQQLVKQARESAGTIPVADDEIPLVTDVDERLYPTAPTRLVDVIHAEVRRSGASPRDFADRLRRSGLLVEGAHRLPDEWVQFQPPVVLAALRSATADYLGGEIPAQADAPRTAADFAAGITLGHSALRPRLENALVDLARRSAPYAEFEGIAGGEPPVMAFLYCDPSVRSLLEERLLVRTRLANLSRSDARAAASYSASDPYSVVLLQYLLAAPGGAQRDLQRAARHRARLLATGCVRPLFAQRGPRAEVRLLPQRPSDRSDCEALLAAAQKAHIVAPLGDGERFYFAAMEPSVEALFAPPRLVPRQDTAAFFAGQLRRADFVDFVQRAMPAFDAWPALAARLRRERDSHRVATGLVEAGVLRRSMDDVYCVAAAPPAGGAVPSALYARRPGPVVGLAHDEFVARLLDRDLLYNTLFWRVADALDGDSLSPNDVPAFVRVYLKWLGF